MKRYFIDWSRSKNVVVIDEDGNVRRMTTKEMTTKKTKTKEGKVKKPTFDVDDELYMETGFSGKIMYRLLDEGCIIYRIPGQLVSDVRGEREKTDEGDAGYIKETWELYTDRCIGFRLKKPTPDERKLRRLYTMYRQVTRDIVRFTNIVKSQEWEYGIKGKSVYEGNIEDLDVLKKTIFEEMKPLIKEELRRFKKLKGIKGIAAMTMAQLLAIAHPKNFKTKSKYLAYVGCKARTFYKKFNSETGIGEGRGRHNWEAKIVGVIMANNVMRHSAGVIKKELGIPSKGKDKRSATADDVREYISRIEGRGDEVDATIRILQKWYYNIKERFHNENPEWSDGICHGKARNRLRTYIMKEIYDCLKDMGTWPTAGEVFGGG